MFEKILFFTIQYLFFSKMLFCHDLKLSKKYNSETLYNFRHIERFTFKIITLYWYRYYRYTVIKNIYLKNTVLYTVVYAHLMTQTFNRYYYNMLTSAQLSFKQ